MTWHPASPLNMAPYHFRDATKMVEITLVRIRRNEAGNTDYFTPNGDVLMVIDCEDGLIVILKEKR